MARRPFSILEDAQVKQALALAWEQSNPSSEGGPEQGGFILLGPDGRLVVSRWPAGAQATIRVPAHAGCRWNGMDIVATFHTHPNTGPGFLQEPSETDKRGVRDDRDLKGAEYVGEFVIADETIHLVTPGGAVREMGEHAELLGSH